MSERCALSLNEEIHALRRDVTEKLAGWERQLAAWPQAVAESVVEAVETAEERQSATFLGWSQAPWQGLLVGIVLTLVLVGIGLTGYWLVGPPSALEAEVALYRRLWGVTTEAERARIQERLRSGTPSR